MPNIYDLAKEFQKKLAERDEKTIGQVLDSYEKVLKNLTQPIEKLETEIQALQENDEFNQSKVFTLERYRELQQQITDEINIFAGNAANITSSAQSKNIEISQSDANALIFSDKSRFSKLPKKAIEKFIGLAGDGTPLADLFASIAPLTADGVKSALLEGIALGYNPRKISQTIRKNFGTPAARALTIARTESIRAYREASRETYKANKNIVAGWVWHAQLSTRTCALCWAMHGTRHSLDEPMASHPACRCVMLPDLGNQQFVSGAEGFAKLSETDQKTILGKAAFEKYSAGEIKLNDFVGERQSERWGKVRYRRALSEILPDKLI